MSPTKTAKAKSPFKTSHVRATETFSTDLVTDEIDKIEIGRDEKDEPIFEEKQRTISVTVRRDQLVPADEPVVAKHPEFFTDVQIDRPAVEQATAAPGEKRG